MSRPLLATLSVALLLRPALAAEETEYRYSYKPHEWFGLYWMATSDNGDRWTLDVACSESDGPRVTIGTPEAGQQWAELPDQPAGARNIKIAGENQVRLSVDGIEVLDERLATDFGFANPPRLYYKLGPSPSGRIINLLPAGATFEISVAGSGAPSHVFDLSPIGREGAILVAACQTGQFDATPVPLTCGEAVKDMWCTKLPD